MLVAMDRVVWTARFRLWKKRNPCRVFEGGNAEREVLYEHLIATELGERPLSYLEFGVADGHSLRWWLAANQDSGSVFVGFDSFEGLPEDWTTGKRAGTFGRGGKPPEIDDRRCTFAVGLFQETVRSPALLDGLANDLRKVVHLDADLYTSTILVLIHIAPHLVSGDVLIFDEFNDVLNEFRALVEASRIARFQLEAIARVGDYNVTAFRVV